jgi:hypothetical protein
MASYKDPSNLQFNPYVQQRPVEAMMKVGMYKQERYNEGLQKIQQGIDNVAGLDVARDVDKKYLESKLNKLGNNLTNVAGGDFSNFQLVNSVNGMTNQIVKDPNVLNAVSSASKYRKELEFQNKSRQEGKSSESNDHIFNRDSSAWLNNEDLNASYNVKYTPYTDVSKESQEVIKGLAKEYTENDIAFDYDSDGNIVAVRDIMTRQKIEGITPERIQAALKTSLSPNAWNQLSIDGIYKYSNVSPEGFVNDINTSYTKSFTELSNERERLETLANSSNNPKHKKHLESQIQELDKMSNSVRTEYDSLSKGFANGDVESAKAQLYTMNWMENTANAFSSSSSSQTNSINPQRTLQLAEATVAQGYARIIETQKQNSITNNFEKLKQEALKKSNLGFGNIPLPVSKETTSVEVIASTQAKIEIGEGEVNTAKEAFKNKYNVTDKGYDELMTNLNKGIAFKRSDQVRDLSAIKSLSKDVNNLKRTYTRAQMEAEQINPDEISKLFPDLKNKLLFINDKDGKKHKYDYVTAAIEFDKFEKKYGTPVFSPPNSTGSVLANKEISNLDDLASKDLKEADYKLYQIWKNKGKGFGSETATVYQGIMAVKDKVASYNTKLQEERNTYVKDYMTNSYIIPQQTAVGINKEKIPAFKTWVEELAKIADLTNGLPNFDGTASSIREINKNLDLATISAGGVLGSNQVTITGTDGKTLNIPITKEMYDSFGDRFEASPAVKEFNNKYLPSMLSTPREIVYKVDQVNLDREITSLKNKKVVITNELLKNLETKYSVPTKAAGSFWTTSKDGKYETTQANSGLSGIVDFPSTSYYGISGNITSDQNPSGAETYSIQLNIYDPIEEVLYENLQFPLNNIDKTRLVPTLRQINDEDIWGLLNSTTKKMPTSHLKKLEDSVKNIK